MSAIFFVWHSQIFHILVELKWYQLLRGGYLVGKKICGTQHLQVSRKEWESWGGGAPIGISWSITVLYSYNHDQLSLTSRKPTSLSMMDSTNRMCLQLFARSKLRVAGLPPGMQWQEVKVGGLGFCWDGVVLSKWDQKESAGIFWSLSTLDFGFWDLFFFRESLKFIYSGYIYICICGGGSLSQKQIQNHCEKGHR